MARTQHHYCEVDGDHYELARLWDRDGDPYWRVRRLAGGLLTADIFGRPRMWRVRRVDGMTDLREHRRLCHAVCTLRDMGWIEKYR